MDRENQRLSCHADIGLERTSQSWSHQTSVVIQHSCLWMNIPAPSCNCLLTVAHHLHAIQNKHYTFIYHYFALLKGTFLYAGIVNGWYLTFTSSLLPYLPLITCTVTYKVHMKITWTIRGDLATKNPSYLALNPQCKFTRTTVTNMKLR